MAGTGPLAGQWYFEAPSTPREEYETRGETVAQVVALAHSPCVAHGDSFWAIGERDDGAEYNHCGVAFRPAWSPRSRVRDPEWLRQRAADNAADREAGQPYYTRRHGWRNADGTRLSARL